MQDFVAPPLDFSAIWQTAGGVHFAQTRLSGPFESGHDGCGNESACDGEAWRSDSAAQRNGSSTCLRCLKL